MDHAVNWDNLEKTVVRVQLDAGWTWDDFMSAMQAAFALAYSTDRLVDLIVSGLDWNIPPGNMLTRLKRMHQEKPTNLGIMVSVGYNPLWDKIAGVLARVYPSDHTPLIFADSDDEARELLTHRTHFVPA